MGLSFPQCPACKSLNVFELDDFERNLKILRCDDCHESYAFTEEDLYNFGYPFIFKEWHQNYKSQLRIEV